MSVVSVVVDPWTHQLTDSERADITRDLPADEHAEALETAMRDRAYVRLDAPDGEFIVNVYAMLATNLIPTPWTVAWWVPDDAGYPVGALILRPHPAGELDQTVTVYAACVPAVRQEAP